MGHDARNRDLRPIAEVLLQHDAHPQGVQQNQELSDVNRNWRRDTCSTIATNGAWMPDVLVVEASLFASQDADLFCNIAGPNGSRISKRSEE